MLPFVAMPKLVRLRSRTHTSWIISCLRQRFCVEIGERCNQTIHSPSWIRRPVPLGSKLSLKFDETWILLADSCIRNIHSTSYASSNGVNVLFCPFQWHSDLYAGSAKGALERGPAYMIIHLNEHARKLYHFLYFPKIVKSWFEIHIWVSAFLPMYLK